jgi:acetyltransferase-like isoleucine patch superfamily enzyme
MIVEAHYIDVVRRRFFIFICSAIAVPKAWWWGVKIKGRIKVFGKILFRRLPKSSIEIGSGCMFNSSANSNLIGVNRPCMLSTLMRDARITIGENCGFSGTVIGAFKSVTIGNNVNCGANTLITDSDWHPEDYRSGEPNPVVIGNNVWLGANSVILKGVTIGDNAFIGINSVVTKNIPANVVAAGNPCKVIKEIQSVKVND